MARLAEQAERYDDMVEYMKRVAEMDKELDGDERNLLSAAFKNSISSRRAAWRVVGATSADLATRGDAGMIELVSGYKTKVEAELAATCEEVLALVANEILPKSSTMEGKVFFTKMRGDYFRYCAEFSVDSKKEESVNGAREAYSSALQLAEQSLPPPHPLRLGLALNYSVFSNDYDTPDQACTLARKAYDQAIEKLDQVSEEGAREEATQILQLLRDNLQLWTADAPASKAANNDLEVADM